MTPLLALQLLGLAVVIVYGLVAFGCYKLWHRSPPAGVSEKRKNELRGIYAVWAMFFWITAMGIGHYLAGFLNDWN